MAAAGRPRDPEVSDHAMAAAIRLIVEDGYPNLTMERIAERAEVSKAALYRRWPNKLALVADAVEDFSRSGAPVPDTGTLKGDMVRYLNAFVHKRRAEAEIHEALHAALETTPDLAARCREVLVAGFHRSFSAMVTRAVQRGELPPDTDVELLADLAPALLRYRRQSTGRPIDEALIRRVVEQFFDPQRTAVPAR